MEPGHAGAGAGRDRQYVDGRIDAPGEPDAGSDIEIEMRQQIRLVEQHQVRCGEHVGIFERLVLALRDRQHDHLVCLAQVEGGGTDEVADTLDEEKPARSQRQMIERVTHHMRVEMAAFAGIDLDRRRAGGADALGIVRGLLVTLDHRDRAARQEIADDADKERGFPAPGLETRFSASRPAAASRARFARAYVSFLERMSRSTRISRSRPASSPGPWSCVWASIT